MSEDYDIKLIKGCISGNTDSKEEDARLLATVDRIRAERDELKHRLKIDWDLFNERLAKQEAELSEARAQLKALREDFSRRWAVTLRRSLERLHIAIVECGRIGFEESSPTKNAEHAAIWLALNDAQKDAKLKLETYSKLAVQILCDPDDEPSAGNVEPS